MNYNYYIETFLPSVVFLDGKYRKINASGNVVRKINDLGDGYRNLKFAGIRAKGKVVIEDNGNISYIKP